MNEGANVKELTREEIREIAEETLKALGVEPVELSEEERKVIRKAAEERMGKKGNKRK